eukprot:1157065-Pelagomonas_calceolata.AAC.5
MAPNAPLALPGAEGLERRFHNMQEGDERTQKACTYADQRARVHAALLVPYNSPATASLRHPHRHIFPVAHARLICAEMDTHLRKCPTCGALNDVRIAIVHLVMQQCSMVLPVA